jgi:hypothetical protein
MMAYVVTKDTQAAVALTRENKSYGPGGLPQLYVPDHETVLRPSGQIPLK